MRSSQIAPYLTLFINGGGWAPGYPRMMTNEHLGTALELASQLGGFRFQNIGDISCDPHVSNCYLMLAGRTIYDHYLGRPAIPHALNHPFETVRHLPPRGPPISLAQCTNDGRRHPPCVHPTRRLRTLLKRASSLPFEPDRFHVEWKTFL
jgi:hypothetical protein